MKLFKTREPKWDHITVDNAFDTNSFYQHPCFYKSKFINHNTKTSMNFFFLEQFKFCMRPHNEAFDMELYGKN